MAAQPAASTAPVFCTSLFLHTVAGTTSTTPVASAPVIPCSTVQPPNVAQSSPPPVVSVQQNPPPAAMVVVTTPPATPPANAMQQQPSNPAYGMPPVAANTAPPMPSPLMQTANPMNNTTTLSLDAQTKDRIAALEQQNTAMMNLLQTEYAQKIADSETQANAARGKMEELTKRVNRMESNLNQIMQILQGAGNRPQPSGVMSSVPTTMPYGAGKIRRARMIYAFRQLFQAEHG